jgi:hypothetical protein
MSQNLQVPNREYLQGFHSHAFLSKVWFRKGNSFDDGKEIMMGFDKFQMVHNER